MEKAEGILLAIILFIVMVVVLYGATSVNIEKINSYKISTCIEAGFTERYIDVKDGFYCTRIVNDTEEFKLYPNQP